MEVHPPRDHILVTRAGTGKVTDDGKKIALDVKGGDRILAILQ